MGYNVKVLNSEFGISYKMTLEVIGFFRATYLNIFWLFDVHLMEGYPNLAYT